MSDDSPRSAFLALGLADAATEPGGNAWYDAKVELGQMGRYQLRKIVGMGGMGMVFEAHDPELDRVIALKVLRATRSGDGEVRLRREGQIMARLTHPNVIRVYDVGVAQGHVFVAMEYVPGGTLADWLTRGRRTAAEVLAVFAQAGAGLAAAHDAGLVHRDFKPSNVLVGDDGRVLVTDFGIARSGEDAAPTGDDRAAAAESIAAAATASGRSPLAAVTRTGEVMGTPAFMAPEQYLSAAVDARADQFSFCVSLWRALYDVAPYAGTTLPELESSTTGGKLVAPPPAALARTPPRVHAALQRGLARAPADRFPSMRALLAALAPPPRRAVRWWIGGGAAVIGVAVVTWVLASRHAAADPCPAPRARAEAVWSPARRAELASRLASIDRATGAARAAASAEVLERAVPAWSAMHVAACRATRVQGSQSDTLLDARMRCLDNWLEHARATVAGVAAAADSRALEAATKAVVGLPSLDQCADTISLTATAALPTDPAQRAEATAILDEAKAVNAARLAGQRDGLVERADATIARARRLDNPAVLTKALGVRWRVSFGASDFVGAVATLRELTEVAARGHDPTEAAYAWTFMGRITGLILGKPDEAKVMFAAARAASASAGDPPDVAVEVLANQANVLQAAGDHAGAEAALARARAVLDANHAGDPGSPYRPRHAGLLQSVAEAAWYAGRLESALAAIAEAKAELDHIYGPATVESAAALLDKAQILAELHRLDEARAAVEEAVAIRAALEGDSIGLAMALMIQVDILRQHGDAAEAITTGERAVAMAKATMAVDDPQLADIQLSVAMAYAGAKRYDDALAVFDAVLPAATAASPGVINVATWWGQRAAIEQKIGRCREAVEHFRKSAELAGEIEGPESHHVGEALRGAAECEAKLGDTAAAIAALERALTCEVSDGEIADAAFAKATLGRLLVETGRDRGRGATLVKEAIAAIAGSTVPAVTQDPRRPGLEAWAAAHVH